MANLYTGIQKQIWLRLGTCSRRALRKTTKKWGHPYVYSPRSDLIENLSYELKVEPKVIAEQLFLIRQNEIKRYIVPNSKLKN